MKSTVYHRSLLAASMAAFGFSLYIPAVALTVGSMRGYELIILGWLGFFQGSYAWFANIFYFIALILLLVRKYVLAIFFSGIGLFLAAFFYWIIQPYPLVEPKYRILSSPLGVIIFGCWRYYCFL